MDFNYPFILTSFFFLCFLFSLIINYILLKFVQTLGIRGKEADQVRWNPNAKPALGGISFYVIFLFAFIVTILLSDADGHRTSGYNVRVLGILIGCTIAFIMGLADDAFNTNPLLKFLTQVVCAFVVIVSGHYINIFENQFLNYLLTVLWIVGMMNSINMLDNMDGITSIISIIICLFMIALNVSKFNTVGYITILNLGVLGALCGFLIFNFHPSKMFMGDTGSQFLGLFLGTMGIDNCWNLTNAATEGIPLFGFVIVLLVFLIPLTDTTTVVINRLRAGRSPFIGGKDHTTHHLFFKGITEKRIAILYFVLGISGIVLAYNLVFNFSFLLLYLSVGYILLVFVTLYLNTIFKKA